MNQALNDGVPVPQGPSLLDALARLAPALEGFPVNQLLDVWVTAEERDRAAAYRMVDHCLVQWIATLEGALHDFPGDASDAVQRVQARQQDALDALCAIKATLSGLDVARRRPQ